MASIKHLFLIGGMSFATALTALEPDPDIFDGALTEDSPLENREVDAGAQTAAEAASNSETTEIPGSSNLTNAAEENGASASQGTSSSSSTPSSGAATQGEGTSKPLPITIGDPNHTIVQPPTEEGSDIIGLPPEPSPYESSATNPENESLPPEETIRRGNRTSTERERTQSIEEGETMPSGL